MVNIKIYISCKQKVFEKILFLSDNYYSRKERERKREA